MRSPTAAHRGLHGCAYCAAGDALARDELRSPQTDDRAIGDRQALRSVQDLRDLALFTDTYAEDMKRIGVDVVTMPKHARELASKYENMVNERRTVSDAEKAATALRDRAATHQWEAVSEIRAAGSYRFRNDPDILPLFQSGYRRRHCGGKKNA